MRRSRLLFVDNLRILLVAMVIVLHLSTTYGGEGGWFYKEGRADTLTAMLLTWYNATAQSFFMGLLFLIAAFFTPGSYDRKGPGPFLRDRFLRLGVPLLIYEFIIHPLQAYPLVQAGALDIDGTFREFLVSYYTSFHIGSGPLWFVETLLIFAVVYAACRAVRKRPTRSTDRQIRPPGLKAMLAFAMLLGVLSFVVRIRLPVGWAFARLNLQFPFFAQYIAMLAVGVVAYRQDWFTRLPAATARPCLVLASVLVLVVFPLMVVLGGAAGGDVSRFIGGLHWQAFAYAMWEQLVGLSVMAALLVLFRERFNRQSALAEETSASSYTAYIIHAPVLILLTLAVRDLRLYALLKFALVVAIAVPLCFALAAAIRRLPAARRIL
ncbi:MAG: acyltransferase family protein [Sedimentisphaerales bacterium]|nr:acyltransferase family protein [Sedimentisphaerales bacterium]